MKIKKNCITLFIIFITFLSVIINFLWFFKDDYDMHTENSFEIKECEVTEKKKICEGTENKDLYKKILLHKQNRYKYDTPLVPKKCNLYESDCFVNRKLEKREGIEPGSIFEYKRDCDIFFLLLVRDDLNWRFCCSLETAAILHPNLNICLYHEKELNENLTNLYKKFSNIIFHRFERREAFLDTPLELFWEEGMFEWKEEKRNGDDRLKETHDIMRLAILYKHNGGFYGDLDNIFFKSLESIDKDTLFYYFDTKSKDKNTDDNPYPNMNSAYAFVKDSFLLKLILYRTYGWFKGNKNSWSYMGPKMITGSYDILPQYVKENIFLKKTYFIMGDKINDMMVADIKFKKGKDIYERMINGDWYFVHVWRSGFESIGLKINVEKSRKLNFNSVLTYVYEKHCPSSYDKIKEFIQNCNKKGDCKL